MKKVAIITGASSGIGKRFAETARENAEFDELWIIARREDRLKQLAETFDFPVKTIALDLSDRDSFKTYAALLEEEKPEVTTLILCSGFGKFDSVENVSLEDQLNMMDLNCGAVMAMSKITVPYMTKGSHIINIASVAAFQPIPYINVYGASKAFVLSFSRALNREVKKYGITVTAVCPFWTKTEFFDRAVDSGKDAVVKKYAAMYDPKDIVKRAWRDSKRGKDVSKFGFVARAQVLLVKILPHKLVMDIWMSQQKLK